MGKQTKSVTLTSLQKETLNLERKYFYILHNAFSSPEFLRDLKNIESNIKGAYLTLATFSQVKNKISVALERLMRFYMYKTIEPESVYDSPLSSDLAYYTSDALINIDAKSIDLISNSTDANTVQVEKNQISFQNKPLYVQTPFPGFKYTCRLPKVDPLKNLPCLSYFLQCTYKDDGTNFDIIGISFSCVPNGELADLFDHDIIKSYKTYEYITETAANRFGVLAFRPVKTKKSHWVEMQIARSKRYFDNTLTNPIYSPDPVLWGKNDSGDYLICLDGKTARINPEFLKIRYDGNNNLWNGYIEIEI